MTRTIIQDSGLAFESAGKRKQKKVSDTCVAVEENTKVLCSVCKVSVLVLLHPFVLSSGFRSVLLAAVRCTWRQQKRRDEAGGKGRRRRRNSGQISKAWIIFLAFSRLNSDLRPLFLSIWFQLANIKEQKKKQKDRVRRKKKSLRGLDDIGGIFTLWSWQTTVRISRNPVLFADLAD